VTAFAVLGGIAGCSGIRQQCSRWRIEQRQPLVVNAEIGTERVVATGVENDQIERIARPSQNIQQNAEIDRLRLDVGTAADFRIHRQEEIAPVQLHAMTGVIEHAYPLVARQRHAISANRILQLATPRIQLQRNVESRLAQPFGHCLGIVARVEQFADRITAVANYQGVA